MPCGVLDWILEQEKDIIGKTGDIQNSLELLKKYCSSVATTVV